MSIATIGFPDAAPINYQDGEVRHFSPEDGFGPEALQRPTRMLACRDNLLRDKLNEVVDWANNREQYVNVPIMATVLPGLAVEVVSNFGIPVGFQARVFSAKVSTNGSNGVLRVTYSPGTFGEVSGGEVLAVVTSAVAESTLDTEFRAGGELIVTLENQGASKARLVGSLILTLRPLGEIDGALVEATIGVGTPGPRGNPGVEGPKGDTGATGATAYGLMWSGEWDPGTIYRNTGATHDVVSTTDVAGNVSSWVCVAVGGQALGVSQRPPTTVGGISTFWAPLATSFAAVRGDDGSQGPVGLTGSPGLRFRGAWASGTADYAVDDVVVTTNGAVHRTWRCGQAATGVDPTTSGQSVWTEMFGSSVGPTYSSRVVNLVASSSTPTYVPGSAGTGDDLDYGAQPTLPINSPGTEITVEGGSQTSGLGVSILTYSLSVVFKGSVIIKLPTAGSGSGQSRAVWATSMCNLTATAHGLQPTAALTTTTVTPAGDTAHNHDVSVIQPYPVSVLRVVVDGGVIANGLTGQKNGFKLVVGASSTVRVSVQLVGFITL